MIVLEELGEIIIELEYTEVVEKVELNGLGWVYD